MRLRIEENVKSQKMRDQFMPLVDYYLAGEGGSLTAVLKTAFDVDILKLLRKVDTTRDDLIDVRSLQYHQLAFAGQPNKSAFYCIAPSA